MDFPQEDQVIASRILKEQFGIMGSWGVAEIKRYKEICGSGGSRWRSGWDTALGTDGTTDGGLAAQTGAQPGLRRV